MEEAVQIPGICETEAGKTPAAPWAEKEKREAEGQMSLFAPPLPEPPQGLSKAAESVLRDLKRKNILKLTPLDALNYLYRLQKRLADEEKRNEDIDL